MVKGEEFDCADFLRCLSDYFDGELDAEIRVRVEEHMRACRDARCFAATFEKTIRLHQKPSAPKVPADVHERLLSAVRKCAARQRRS